MEETKHVMFSSKGAERVAKDAGLEIVYPNYFYQKNRLDDAKRIKKENSKMGTVGVVAIDKDGNIAAGTSTGGMTNKMPGRVGDSPIIGSGTWAQNGICGVSSTGHGEFFIKFQVAKEVCTRMEYLNQSLDEAATNIIEELKLVGASGGLIAMDKEANISTPFNTSGMIRGSITNKADLNISIY